jgi:hypothetical protein
VGGVEQEWILFAVRLPVCVTRRVREPDPGSSAQARPQDRRVWSGGSRDSVVDLPDLHGLGNAPYGCRDGHGHHARHAALDRLGSCPRVLMWAVMMVAMMVPPLPAR